MTRAELFLRDILQESFGRTELDCFWLTEEAAKRGFLVKVAFDPEIHANVHDAERGEMIYVLAPELREGKS